MSIPRSFAGVVFVGLIPFFIGCGSDKKPNNAPTWVGRTYLLDIPVSHWREPKGADEDVGASVPKFLLEVKSAPGNALEVLMGAGDANGVQDTCSPTSTVSATSQYPGIQIGPACRRGWRVYPKHEPSVGHPRWATGVFHFLASHESYARFGMRNAR